MSDILSTPGWYIYIYTHTHPSYIKSSSKFCCSGAMRLGWCAVVSPPWGASPGASPVVIARLRMDVNHPQTALGLPHPQRESHGKCCGCHGLNHQHGQHGSVTLELVPGELSWRTICTRRLRPRNPKWLMTCSNHDTCICIYDHICI